MPDLASVFDTVEYPVLLSHLKKSKSDFYDYVEHIKLLANSVLSCSISFHFQSAVTLVFYTIHP